jgi:PAS domain S-box-containing protein
MLALVLDSMFAFVALVTPDGVLLEVNRAPLEAARLSKGEVIGTSFADSYWFSHSTDAQAAIRDALARVAGGETVRQDFEVRVATDRVITIDAVFAPLRTGRGDVGHIAASGVDVTDRRRTEGALRESDQRFRQLTEAIHEVFWLLDVDTGCLLYISPGYERIWGRSRPVLQDTPLDWINAVHPDDRDRVVRALTSMRASGHLDEEYRIVRPDGSIRWIRDRGYPLKDTSGRVIRIAGVAEDITEQRALEAQLRHAQKMDSVGQLAGGVAHDFNNILTVIGGSAEVLTARLTAADADTRDLLTEINKSAKRAAALTRQLLVFSRQQVLEPRVIELNAAVTDAETMLRRLVGEDIRFTTALDPAVGRVKIDPGYLAQVLVNLAVNSRDAMPGGGTLTIATRAMVLDEAYAATHPNVQPGRYVALVVHDSGTGIPPEVQSRIFDPFFTTKGAGRGTGLGLAVVHGIVQQSGGHIDVESEPSRGTTFTICVPEVDDPVTRDAEAHPAPALRGTETVLLVEDDAPLRGFAARTLSDHGYRVLEASDGPAAVGLFKTHAGAVDLVVTDVVMPEMSGCMLVKALRMFHPPGLKVLYMSGYTDDAVVRQGIMHEEVAFLRKPFDRRVLLERVRELLDAPQRR